MILTFYGRFVVDGHVTTYCMGLKSKYFWPGLIRHWVWLTGQADFVHGQTFEIKHEKTDLGVNLNRHPKSISNAPFSSFFHDVTKAVFWRYCNFL